MAIEFDASRQTGLNFSTGGSYAHTTGTGKFRHLIAAIHMADHVTISGTPTYGGVPLILIDMDVNTHVGGARVYLYHLVDPKSGANNLVYGMSGNSVHGLSVTTRTGVDPNNPIGASNKADASLSSAVSVIVSSGEGEVVVDGVTAAMDNPGSFSTGALQTWRTKQGTSSSFGWGYTSSDEPGQASVTMSHTLTSSNPLAWATVAVPLKPKVGGLERAVKYFHNVWDPSRAILDNAGRSIPIDQIQGDNYLRTLGVLLPTAKVYSDLIENPEVGYIESIKKDDTQNVARIKAGKESLLETFLSRLAGRGV